MNKVFAMIMHTARHKYSKRYKYSNTCQHFNVIAGTYGIKPRVGGIFGPLLNEEKNMAVTIF